MHLVCVSCAGGVVLEKQSFDPSCTHVVVGYPLRNEKYLAAMAAGKWILHRSYLEACRAEGHFIKVCVCVCVPRLSLMISDDVHVLCVSVCVLGGAV